MTEQQELNQVMKACGSEGQPIVKKTLTMDFNFETPDEIAHVIVHNTESPYKVRGNYSSEQYDTLESDFPQFFITKLELIERRISITIHRAYDVQETLYFIKADFKEVNVTRRLKTITFDAKTSDFKGLSNDFIGRELRGVEWEESFLDEKFLEVDSVILNDAMPENSIDIYEGGVLTYGIDYPH